ncbi:MAG: Fe-S protein assembly co-chaperone HscB, partial [Pseudomonadota bacterium]|nr:Fe-S protein assembly co-chaperone HscB [Pseudomonadota bacterium]
MELTQNYFELFDLPVSFEIDRDDLGQKYRQLQQSNHPDNFAQATEAERRLAMQKSTHINEAFHTLKDPMSR